MPAIFRSLAPSVSSASRSRRARSSNRRAAADRDSPPRRASADRASSRCSESMSWTRRMCVYLHTPDHAAKPAASWVRAPRGPPLPHGCRRAYTAPAEAMSSDTPHAEPRAELDRLRAEAAVLREAVRNLSATVAEQRELVWNINSIVLRWDPQGRIIYLNEYGQDFFGYALSELPGRSVVGTIVPQHGYQRARSRQPDGGRPPPPRTLPLEREREHAPRRRARVGDLAQPSGSRPERQPARDRVDRHRHHARASAPRMRCARASIAIACSSSRRRSRCVEGDASALKVQLDDLLAAGGDVDAWRAIPTRWRAAST